MAREGTAGERLERLVSQLAARRGIPHVVLRLESGDGSLPWQGAAGPAGAGSAAMTPGTPFFIASIDKMFTAAVVLKLCERGQVRLDQPAAAYLPEPIMAGLHRTGGRDCSGAITVRHLLSHTSGLADWLMDRPKEGPSLFEQVLAEGDRDLSLEEILEHVRERLNPHFPPQPLESGRLRVRYCDTNFLLLNALIEQATGQPLEQVHARELFGPLGMRQTWLVGRSRPEAGVLEAAALWNGERTLELPRLLRSIWGIYSTAGDLICFLRALMGGGVFEDPATLGQMQQWRRLDFPLDFAALRSPSWPLEYGLGMLRFRALRLGRAWRLIGHSGSTGCWLFYCRQMNVFCAGSVDEVSAGALPYRLVPKALDAWKDLAARGRAHAEG